jgi:RecA/RadA recombinase
MCLAETRQKLLADLFTWLDDVDPARERVFWLNGLAGTGKTTVARTIAARAHKQGRLAAAFFFSRNVAVTRSPSAILPTIAYQLADYQHPFRTAVCTAVGSNRDVRDRGIATQADVLFSNLRGVTVPDTPLLIVIDALDECYLENGREGGDAVPLLLAQFAFVPSVKILITSRVEDTLKHMFDGVTNLALHNIEADIVQSDILHYLKHTLGEHARVRKLPLPFPTDDGLRELVSRSGKLFIYAATVAKWVSDSKADPKLRLQQVLDQDVDEMVFQHKLLDGMYLQIIAGAAQTSGNPLPHERALADVLSTVVLLQEPMHAPALASLAGQGQRASAILPLLSAVILVDETAPVRLFHPSFSDFITDEGRCSDKRFLVMRAEGHLRLAIRCLEIMNAGLRENICDLEDPSLPNNEVADLELRLEHAALPELRYACKYWHVHVCLANFTSPDLVKCLAIFCTSHLLHWVELLSLLDDIQRLIGPNSMRSLLTCLEVSVHMHVTDLC